MRLSDRQIADRGYDQDKYRRLVWKRGIKPIIASRRTEHRSGLGRHRWIVERTFAWLHNRRRVRIRTDRRDDIHEGFLRPRLPPRLPAAARKLDLRELRT